MSGDGQNRLAVLRGVRQFALLTLDGQHWLLPRHEVQTLQSLADIDPMVRAPHSIGALAYAGEWWPVYCLSGELNMLSHLPAQRRICVVLNNRADQFALICDHIETLAEPPDLHPLPNCMALPESAIDALILLDRGLVCVSSTEQIARRIAAAEDLADA